MVFAASEELYRTDRIGRDRSDTEMATERQIAANRRNAEKSTGPRTAEGKARSRANAMTHGLAAETIDAAIDPTRAEAAEKRLRDWEAEFRPGTEEGCWALGQAVSASIRIEDCEQSMEALVVKETSRARLAWEIDRRIEASDLADGLARRPESVVPRLEGTRHGVEVMLIFWAGLSDALDADGGWSEAEAGLALDLLGVPKLLRRGRTAITSPDGSSVADHRRAVVDREIARLRSLKARALDELDELDRAQAEGASTVLLSKPARLLHRYHADAWRRFRSCLKIARDSSSDEPNPAVTPLALAPEPEPDTEPEPTPVEPPTPATHAEIRAHIWAIEERVRTAATEDELESAMAEMKSAIAAYGPRLDEAAPFGSLEESPRLNRHQRRALKARHRRA